MFERPYRIIYDAYRIAYDVWPADAFARIQRNLASYEKRKVKEVNYMMKESAFLRKLIPFCLLAIKKKNTNK